MDNKTDETTVRPTLDAPPIAEAMRGLRVERVDRVDGSYALYFSWPAETSADEPVMGLKDADV